MVGRLSIRAKLVFIACAVLFVAMAANTAVNGLVFSQEYSRALLSRTSVIGDSLNSQLQRLLNLNIPINQLIGFEEQCREVLARHDFLSYAMVVSPRGEIFFHSDPTQHGRVIEDPTVLAHLKTPQAASHVFSNGRQRFYEVFTPVLHRGEHVATVRIGFPATFVRSRINAMVAYSGGVAFIVVSLGIALLVVSLNVWVWRPLGRLIQARNDMTREGMAVEERVEGPARDEIERLRVTFDGMLSDLEQQRNELERTNAELGREIVERKRAEEEIRASEAKYQDLYHNAPDMFASVDARTGTIQQCNRTLAASLGYPEEEVIGRHIVDLHESECGESVREVFETAARASEVRDTELRLRRKAGGTIDVSLNVSTLRDAEGRVVHYRAVWRDVTERKRAEAALREREAQLRQASKLAAVGQLAAGVAHEVNNPLAVIMGQAELLAQTSPDPNVSGRVRKILAHADRAARIIQELQNFARPKPPKQTVFGLPEIVHRVVDLRRHTLEVSGIGVHVEIPPGLPPVQGDPGQLEQVVLNLLLNAEQAVASRNDQKAITIRLAGGNDRVRLTVADTGPGIPPDVLPRIFEPFFTTKPVGQGTGLGLSICYSIVEAHKGRIWVEGSPGHGATFIIELPAHRAEKAAEEAPPPKLPAFRRGHVLVVEDEEGVAEVLSDLLGLLGQTVTVAAGGEAGWERLKQPHASYDVVTLDVKMPDLSGPALWRRLVSHGIPLGDRVVFVTGDTVDPETHRFLEESGRPIVTKPVSLEALTATLSRWLASSAAEAS
jgi:PAS domain S-box-containing protein